MSNPHRIDDLILLAEKGMGWQRYDSAKHDWPNWQSAGLYTIVSSAIVIPGNGPHNIWNPYTNPTDAMVLQFHLGIGLTAIGHPVKRWQAGSNKDELGSTYVEAIVEGGGTEAICQAINECALKIVRARKGSTTEAIEKS